jgi:long-chain-fatty-acid---luciferin-component ligase
MTQALSSCTATLVNRVLEEPSRLDRVIFGSRQDPFAMTPSERDHFLLDVVVDSLQHHVRNNPRVASFFARHNFSPESLGRLADLDTIPLLSADVYKRMRVTSAADTPIVRSFTSSGTSGAVSRIERDNLTLQRLSGSIRQAARLLEPWVPRDVNDEDLELVNLGPSREEAGEIWFAYIMAMAEIIAPSTYYVSGGVSYLEAAADAVMERITSGGLIGIVGAPFLLFELAKRFLSTKKRPKAHERLFVITGGGWKRNQAQAVVPSTLRAMTVEAFGLVSESQIRDGFNQVELNSIFFECDYHRKHVPPWVHVTARHIETLKAIPAGEAGLMSYVDASAMSYPCFFIADDLGTVSADPCPCGRTGPTVTYHSRIARQQAEGCSSKLDAKLTDRRRK